MLVKERRDGFLMFLKDYDHTLDPTEIPNFQKYLPGGGLCSMSVF